MKKSGFTLAEVLITLVIIGVIAAMTVPTLMNNTNSQEFRSALKKAISALNQAVTMQYALEGTLISDYNSAENVVKDVFNARLNVINTGAGTDTTLWAGASADNSNCSGSVFITADGLSYCIQNFSNASGSTTGACDSSGSTPCSTNNAVNVLIDVNGLKKPNKLTTSSAQPKDIYQAHLYSQRVVPVGAATQEVMYDANLQ
ncbi:prepilin-type N-terminal cleavage/methylation domain-containing protein [bacterium]|nr:prepilin-type N-terminal cleavage/methylation domain-containing protein [bacterium]